MRSYLQNRPKNNSKKFDFFSLFIPSMQRAHQEHVGVTSVHQEASAYLVGVPVTSLGQATAV